jgi:hypothetical protein
MVSRSGLCQSALGQRVGVTHDLATFTEAGTWDELREAVRDAVRCHFDPDKQPDLIRLHAVREGVVAA